MLRIDRTTRRLLLVAAAAVLTACGDGTTGPDATIPPGEQPPGQQPPPVTPPPGPRPVTGRWGSVRIDGKALPARIAGGTDDGITWELRVHTDTMIVRADGTWEQRVRTRQTQSNGFNFNGSYYDRGVWTRAGDALHFESTYIQHVRFDGYLSAAGSLVVRHDFTLDDELPTLEREMQR